jgi:hypothetical protein
MRNLISKLNSDAKKVLGYALGAAVVIGLAALITMSTQPAHAQFYGGSVGGQTISSLPNTNIIGNTNWITGSNITTVPLYNMRQVVLTLQAQALTNQYGSNVAVAWTRSRDGINWETTPFTVLIASVATNNGIFTNYGPVLVTTNIDMGAYPYIAPMWFTNASYMTNCQIGYSLKPGY